MVELSARTANHVLVLFSADEVADVVRLLTEKCAEGLPIVGPRATPSSLERIRFAALRLSGGDMGRLRYAVELANTDWRDLLVGADFGDDIHAHEKWTPSFIAVRYVLAQHRPSPSVDSTADGPDTASVDLTDVANSHHVSDAIAGSDFGGEGGGGD